MFNLASAPFAHNRKQTQTLMLLVILACLPGFLAQTWFFGWGTLIQTLLALVTALGCEALVLRLRGRPVKPALLDGSAALTAVLIGLSLPPLLPWWMLVLGTAFAIIIAKHLYGGLGQNLFNPAMVAYVLLLVSFPVQMTSWLPPSSIAAYGVDFGDAVSVIFTGFSLDGYSLAQLKQGVDGLTMATPLDTLKTGLTQGLTASEVMTHAVFEGWGGIGWSWVNLCYLLGGLFLLQQKVINWRIPTAVLDHKAYPGREAFDAALTALIDSHDPQGQPALVVLAGFMRILTPGFVAHYEGRLVNIHPSLLPAFTGLHTHQRALDEGCKFAGATVHRVTTQLDHGEILDQAVVPVLPGDTADTLAARVLTQEHIIYPRAVERLLAGLV